jgi:hypothetical protein
LHADSGLFEVLPFYSVYAHSGRRLPYKKRNFDRKQFVRDAGPMFWELATDRFLWWSDQHSAKAKRIDDSLDDPHMLGTKSEATVLFLVEQRNKARETAKRYVLMAVVAAAITKAEDVANSDIFLTLVFDDGVALNDAFERAKLLLEGEK